MSELDRPVKIRCLDSRMITTTFGVIKEILVLKKMYKKNKNADKIIQAPGVRYKIMKMIVDMLQPFSKTFHKPQTVDELHHLVYCKSDSMVKVLEKQNRFIMHELEEVAINLDIPRLRDGLVVAQTKITVAHKYDSESSEEDDEEF